MNWSRIGVSLAKILWGISVLAVISFVGLLGAVAIFLHVVDYDPLDKFEVIDAVAEPGSRRNAVTYRYHHADSSGTFIAVWILPNPAPVIGSKDPVRGRRRPVFVTEETLGFKMEWAGGRLLVETQRPVTLHKDDFGACYFNEGPADIACFDSKQVDVAAPS